MFVIVKMLIDDIELFYLKCTTYIYTDQCYDCMKFNQKSIAVSSGTIYYSTSIYTDITIFNFNIIIYSCI